MTVTRLQGLARVIPNLSYDVRLIRAAKAVYDAHGRIQEQATTEHTIRAHVQTTGDKELELLSEGDRLRGSIRLWTTYDIRAVDVKAGTESDIIEWQGSRYIVTRVEDRTPLGGYRKAIAVREGQ